MAVENLDAKGMDVLEAVHEAGGRASTGEVKELTGIEKNAVILYRFDKMEELGLIETETGEAQGNRIPPRVAVLTEKAQEQIRGGLFADEEPTVVERMDRLERQFKQVTEELHDLQQEFRQFRYDPESDEEMDVLKLVEEVRELREQVERAELEKVARFEEIEPEDVVRASEDAQEAKHEVADVRPEIEQIAAAVKAAGIEPVREDEFFALNRSSSLVNLEGGKE